MKENNKTTIILILIGFIAGAVFMYVALPITSKPSASEPFAVGIPSGGVLAIRNQDGTQVVIVDTKKYLERDWVKGINTTAGVKY